MKVARLALVALVALVAAGCRADPVQKDLIRYLDDGLAKIKPLADGAVNDFESLSKPPALDADTATKKLDGIIAGYQKFVDAANALHPATKDVQALHALLLAMAGQQMDAFVAAKAAYAKAVPDVSEVNEKLAAASASRASFLAMRADLARRHRIELAR